MTVAERNNARYTWFLSGVCILPENKRFAYKPPMKPAGTSAIGFGEPALIPQRIRNYADAYDKGHEIGTHALGHFCSPGGVGLWSSAQWTSELTQFNSFVDNWRTNLGPALSEGVPPLPFNSSAVKGIRTPCLEGKRSAMWPVWTKLGYRYDASNPGSLQWPVKIKGTDIWEFPLQAVKLGGTGKPVLSMDYNFMCAQNNCSNKADAATAKRVEESTYQSLMSALKAVCTGNRAPFFVGNHLNTWVNGAYKNALDPLHRRRRQGLRRRPVRHQHGPGEVDGRPGPADGGGPAQAGDPDLLKPDPTETPMTDVLAPLLGLPGVEEAAAAARTAVDALLWDRAVRNRAPEVASESALRGARASAAIDGADVDLALLRSGAALDDSPIGRALAASVAVTSEVPRLTSTVGLAPLQAVARLAAIAGSGIVPPDRLGRPRADDVADDPLRIGALPPPAAVAARLETLRELLVSPSEAPAIVVAGIAHAEILALRPFPWGSGYVARATGRLLLAARGVDPDLLSAPEVGLLSLGRPAYVAAVRGFASGSPDGVAGWLRHWAQAVAVGADASRAVVDELD